MISLFKVITYGVYLRSKKNVTLKRKGIIFFLDPRFPTIFSFWFILYNNSHADGKDRVAKQIIEEIDEQKQSIKFKMIEGDLMELYKSMNIIYHVDTNGPDSLVTWTLEYEKLKDDNPHPGTLLSFFLHMVEDIEAHHS